MFSFNLTVSTFSLLVGISAPFSIPFCSHKAAFRSSDGNPQDVQTYSADFFVQGQYLCLDLLLPTRHSSLVACWCNILLGLRMLELGEGTTWRAYLAGLVFGPASLPFVPHFHLCLATLCPGELHFTTYFVPQAFNTST
jgi:hypothetical protein